jgi:hypothetical protein
MNVFTRASVLIILDSYKARPTGTAESTKTFRVSAPVQTVAGGTSACSLAVWRAISVEFVVVEMGRYKMEDIWALGRIYLGLKEFLKYGKLNEGLILPVIFG